MNQSNKEHILTFDKDKTIVNLKDGIYQKGTYGTKNYNIELLDDCIIENGKPKKDIVLYGKFKWSQKYLNDFITNEKGEIIIASEVFSPSYIKYGIQADTPTNLISKGDCGVGTSENATKALVELLGTNCFDYPKPTELIEYLSSFSGKTEQNILDVFAGSGTTGIATILHNKNTNSSWHSTLVEKNPENVEMIIKGCENVYSQHNKLHD